MSSITTCCPWDRFKSREDIRECFCMLGVILETLFGLMVEVSICKGITVTS